MPILNGASNIPGMMIQFKDGGLELRQSNAGATPSTRSVLILGTAIDGPVMEPVAVDAVTAEAVFGKGVGFNGKLNGASLPEAFNQLYKAGCRDIRMMRISGSIAKSSIAAAISSEEVTMIKKQTLASTGGNDVCVFDVGQLNISDVHVFSNDVMVASSKFTVDGAAGLVTLNANSVTAGSLITISYTNNIGMSNQTDSLTVGSGNDFVTLTKAPVLTEAITVTVEGESVDPDDVTIGVDRKVRCTNFLHAAIKNASITLTDADITIPDVVVDNTPVAIISVTVDAVDAPGCTIVSGKVHIPQLAIPASGDPDKTYAIVINYKYTASALVAGDDVVVAYKWVSDSDQGTVVKQNSTDIGGEVFVATAGNLSQQITLAKEVTGNFRLYVDGREIGDESAFLVNDDILKIEKKKFPMGLLIEVSYEYTGTIDTAATIELESLFGGAMYNDCTVEVKDVLDEDGNLDDKEIILQKPLNKRNVSDESAMSFFASQFESFGMLVDAINVDPKNNVFKVSTEFPDVNPMTLVVKAKVNFTGGEDQTKLTKQTIFEKLSGKRNGSGELTEYGAYQLLQNYKVDYVAPLGIYGDDELLGKYENFAYELALFCGIASQVHLTHGIIALKPPKKTDLASLELHVKKLEGYSNIFFMRRFDGLFITDNEGGPFDMGGYISVLAGPELTVTSSRQGQFNDSGVLQYAGLVSTLKASSAPTNKKLTSVSGSRFKFSVAQLNRIAAKRFVTFQERVSDNSICPTDGITAARTGSDYSRLCNINVVRTILDDIYKISEPYIGEPISVATNNALASAIDKKLTERADSQSGDIQTYSFQLVTNPLDKLIGDTKIELTIVPLGERRRITVVVGLKPSL